MGGVLSSAKHKLTKSRRASPVPGICLPSPKAASSPDMITMAKGLAAGMHISAVTGWAEVLDAPDKGEVGAPTAITPCPAQQL